MNNPTIRKLTDVPQQVPVLTETIDELAHSIQCMSEQLDTLAIRLVHLLSQAQAPTRDVNPKPQSRGSSATVCRLQAMRGKVVEQQEKLWLILNDLEA